MSKRIKKNRSALKVEALEQRQLLATIVAGSGHEVEGATDKLLPNGNTYDQVLMTGSTLTVTADTVEGVHQVTRVDFLDANGDIVRAEFSGAGELKIDLANFKADVAADGYNTSGKYVQGLATFTITGSDESTNFSVFSLGSATNMINPALFDATHKGGTDHVANVAALVIQDNGSVLGNAFGGIRAGNAVFSAETGAVGIVAPKIQFQGDIIIGDIDAQGNSSPQLRIGEFSSNKTVMITGGDLKQPAGVGITSANIGKLISTSGMTSDGTLVETKIIQSNIVTAENISYKSSAAKVVIDGQTATQAQLDAYKDKFLDEVEIQGGLKEGLTFAARMMGKVTVTGDLAGLITTDVDGDNTSDDNELGIGNVEITGNIVAKGAIESSTSLGNVIVGGGIDFKDINGAKNAGAVAIISTLGRDKFSGKIGDISFGEDVKLDNEDVALVVAANSNVAGTSDGIGKITIAGEFSGGAATVIQAVKGGIGNIDVTNDISVGAISAAAAIGTISGADVTLGALTAGKAIGAISSTDGNLTLAAITATEGLGAIKSDGDLSFSGNVSAKSIGDITSGGDLTVTGTIASTGGNIGAIKATKGALAINNTVTAVGGGIGAITASEGSLTIAGALNSAKGVGAISATKGDLSINSAITAAEGVGAINVTEGDATIGAAITGKSVGAISVSAKDDTGGNLTVNAEVKATSGDIGAITLSGDDEAVALTFGAAGKFTASAGIGNVKVTGGSIVGGAAAAEFTANTIGDVTVVGHDDTAVLLTNVVFKATGENADAAKAKTAVAAAKIGAITLDASAKSGAAIATGASGFTSSLKIGDIKITTADDGKILADGEQSLVFRAGSASLGAKDAVITGDDAWKAGVAVNGGAAIGNVTLSANLSAALSDGDAGHGLVIASGANPVANGQFVTSADGSAIGAITKVGSGNTIGAIVLEDLSGGATFEGFVSASLKGNAAFTAGSAIIADKITSVSLATGAGTRIRARFN